MIDDENHIPPIFFITKVIHHRVPIFAMDERFAMIVIENLKFYRKKYGFALYGYVIMPDHYHILINTWGKYGIEKVKEDMNKFIARQIILDLKTRHAKELEKFRVESAPRKGHRAHEYRIFQKGGVDVELLSLKKVMEKIEYMHKNPIRADLVQSIEEYKFSSACNYYLDEHSLIELDPLDI